MAASPLDACQLKLPLHEQEIEPPVELAADPAEMRNWLEAEPNMKRQRSRILGIDPADHHMLPHRFGEHQELRHQGTANAAPATLRLHMDRMFDGPSVVLIERRS
jgi:hypothetical protein